MSCCELSQDSGINLTWVLAFFIKYKPHHDAQRTINGRSFTTSKASTRV